MPKMDYRGRIVELQSHSSEGRSLPKALVMTDDGDLVKVQKVLDFLDSTFATKEDADAYAVEMAKKWIDEHS